jgi:hypothetical protein
VDFFTVFYKVMIRRLVDVGSKVGGSKGLQLKDKKNSTY